MHVAVDRSARPWWLLGLVLAVAAALRTYGLDHESAWLDEAYAIGIARDGLDTVLRETSLDVHPPLYYVLLHGWTTIAGGSVAAARLLSGLFSLGVILAAVFVATRMTSRATGLVTAALLTVSVFQIEFAQEARMYALLTLLATMSTAALLRLFSTRHAGWLLVYAVVTSLMTYTHVYAVFVIAAHGVTVLIDAVARRRRDALGRWLLAQLLVGVAFLPWLPVFVSQVSEVQADFWIARPHPIALFHPLYVYAGSAVLLAALLPLVARGVVTLARRPDPPDRALRPLWVLVPWMVMPIALPFALSYIGSPIFLPKYTIPASIPWTILAATGIWSLRGRVARAGVLVVCLGLGLYQLPEYYRVATKDGWREAAATIETSAQTGDVVVLYPPFNTIAFNFYHQRPDVPVRGLPFMTASNREAWTTMVERATRGFDRVWFVALRSDPTARVAFEALQSQFAQTSSTVVQKIAIHHLQRQR